MKSAIILLISFLFGVFVAAVWSSMDNDFIVVRIIDNQKCNDREYLLEMENQTISVKGKQIDTTNLMVALEAEAFFYALPYPSTSDQITYRVRAHYSNCTEILSKEREVERGWLIYETIENQTIRHVVRAR